MFDASPENLTSLRFDLSSQGSLVMSDAHGKRLFIVSSHILHTAEKGMLVAYEGGGCFFWTGGFLNRFTLAKQGFGLAVAGALVDFLHALYNVQAEHTVARIESSADDRSDPAPIDPQE